MSSGEEKAWEKLGSLNPFDVCKTAGVSYDNVYGNYILNLFGMDFSVSPQQKAIKNLSPVGIDSPASARAGLSESDSAGGSGAGAVAGAVAGGSGASIPATPKARTGRTLPLVNAEPGCFLLFLLAFLFFYAILGRTATVATDFPPPNALRRFPLNIPRIAGSSVPAASGSSIPFPGRVA